MPCCRGRDGPCACSRWHGRCFSSSARHHMTPHTQPQIVVVGVDYSEASELAIAQALELVSSVRRAELHAVHVASSYPTFRGLEHAPEPMPLVTTPRETRAELE